MTQERAFASPQALRRGVTDRLKTIAAPNGRWTVSELQRQFAYDRLLARLYGIDDGWVLKGAVALLARRVSVRHSSDIDLYREADRTMVERELRAAAELDLGDWFRFEIGAGEALGGTTGGARYPLTAWVGATRWATFHVDLVGIGVRMTGVPDYVPPVAAISVPGIDQPGYRAYPLVDHIADKIAAILEPHGGGRPSTRFRDLIDLTALVTCVRVRAEEQRVALMSEIERRGWTFLRDLTYRTESYGLQGSPVPYAGRLRRPPVNWTTHLRSCAPSSTGFWTVPRQESGTPRRKSGDGPNTDGKVSPPSVFTHDPRPAR